jgi:hypothetical protein
MASAFNALQEELANALQAVVAYVAAPAALIEIDGKPSLKNPF